MLSFASHLQVFLAAGETDMRKSFNSLAALVRQQLGGDPLSGHLFVFCNRRRDRIKVLVWDRGGFWVCAKRLEKGTFHWPTVAGPVVELSAAQLTLLLCGIDLSATRARPWHELSRA